ncbi:glycosyltransferase family 2 protein [Methylomicrobium lacus]|uniref:glycosyltransferase family 2 protein n=1 Tax=Methylomicrobium lacus TaxID=136992 RepID=UPI0035A9A1CB
MVSIFFTELFKTVGAIHDEIEIICINDGSTDQTLQKLIAQKNAAPKHLSIRIIDFSRNFGKEAALTAGVEHARGDAVIPIDTDLQDPPELINALIAKWKEGYEVVLAKRCDRTSDTWLKRKTAKWFYRLHNSISHPPIPEDVGDFRLLSRAAVDALKKLPERERFMKGLFTWVGFKTAKIEYVRLSRKAGDTKFPWLKLWNFALDGITSFSTVPLRIWSYLGFFISLFSFAYGSAIIVRTLVQGVDIPGYASLIVIILFLGGLQLVGIGVLGEYLGRIYMETKNRPIYIIRQEL